MLSSNGEALCFPNSGEDNTCMREIDSSIDSIGVSKLKTWWAQGQKCRQQATNRNIFGGSMAHVGVTHELVEPWTELPVSFVCPSHELRLFVHALRGATIFSPAATDAVARRGQRCRNIKASVAGAMLNSIGENF